MDNPVGPIMQQGDVAEAVKEAAVIDNEGKNVEVIDRSAYIRIQVEGGDCVLRRETIEAELGRPFRMNELELNLSSFVGRIDTSTEAVRFYLGTASKQGAEPKETQG